jgi:hypothetical protein
MLGDVHELGYLCVRDILAAKEDTDALENVLGVASVGKRNRYVGERQRRHA